MTNAVVVKGLQELFRQFDRVSKEINSGCKTLVRKITKEVAADAKAAAPVGRGMTYKNEKTGKDELIHYKNSIKYTMSKSGLYGWAYAGKKNSNSTRGYIGHLLEYGTVKTAAIPHFFPALEKAKRKFEPGLKAVIASVKGGKV